MKKETASTHSKFYGGKKMTVKGLEKARKMLDINRAEHYKGLYEIFGMRIIKQIGIPKGEYFLLVAPDVYDEIMEATKRHTKNA